MRYSPWLLFVALLALAQPLRAETECVRCHGTLTDERLRQPVDQWRVSVHQRDPKACVSCHGGDPDDPTVRAHASELRFVARPSDRQVVDTCGGCHADARFVRRFSATLQVDQWMLYQISRHGLASAAGSDAAPTCSDCHGAHAILSAREPASTVHPQHVAKLCGECHADSERISGLATDQLAKYQRSAHASALERGLDAPTCSDCHGAHGELAAEAATLGQTCNRCHEPELKHVVDSPHAKAFERLGMGSCVPCHQAHDVSQAVPLLLGTGPDGACGRCHTDDAKVLAVIDTMSQRLAASRGSARQVRRDLEEARERGLYLPQSDALLLQLRSAEHQIGPPVHRVDPGALDEPLATVDGAVVALREHIAQADRKQGEERYDGYLLLAALGALLLLLVVKGRS